jgi:hypothetical protein
MTQITHTQASAIWSPPVSNRATNGVLYRMADPPKKLVLANREAALRTDL